MLGPSLRAISVATEEKKKKGFFCSIFFSSSLAVNALWHGPDNDISGEKGGTQLNWPVPVKGQIITQNRKNTDKDDPQIPQPDLRFVSKATKQQDERGQAQQKTPKNDLP